MNEIIDVLLNAMFAQGLSYESYTEYGRSPLEDMFEQLSEDATIVDGSAIVLDTPLLLQEGNHNGNNE